MKLPPDARLRADVGGVLEAAGESSGADVLDPILIHLRLLARWNDAYGLTRITDWPQVLERHVRESLLTLRWIAREEPGRLLDVGSGNGFPALPILACRPRLSGVLLERSERKGLFLDAVVRECGWAERVRIDSSDAESYEPGRAVAVVGQRPTSAADIGRETIRNPMSAADKRESGTEKTRVAKRRTSKKGAPTGPAMQVDLRGATGSHGSSVDEELLPADPSSAADSQSVAALRQVSCLAGPSVHSPRLDESPAAARVNLAQPGGPFEYVVSRATLAPRRYLELACRWVRPGGRVFLFAGELPALSGHSSRTGLSQSALEPIAGRKASFLHVFESPGQLEP